MYIPTARTIIRRAIMAALAAAAVVLGAGSPAHPSGVDLSWSASGRLLAFWCDSGLYAVNPINGGVARVSPRCARGLCSPDGLKVAWSDEDGTFVYHLDTTATVRVAEAGRVAGWSPDSRWVLLEISPPRQAPDIYAADADGRGTRALAAHPAPDEQATWSPDGRWVAFVSERDDSRSDIWVVGWDGSNLTRITSMLQAEDPAWSPDGSRLAFTGRVSAGGPRRIYCLDFTSRKLAAVTAPADGDCHSPAFLSRGVLRYTARQGMAADLSTGQKRTLPRGDLSPDGARLAVLSGRPGALDAVSMSDGSRCAVDKGVEASAWSPDSQLLAYLALTTGPGGGLVRELRIASFSAKGVYVLWSEGLRGSADT